eukprot:g72371.t1
MSSGWPGSKEQGTQSSDTLDAPELSRDWDEPQKDDGLGRRMSSTGYSIQSRLSRLGPCAYGLATGFSGGFILGSALGFVFGGLEALGEENKRGWEKAHLMRNRILSTGALFGSFLAVGFGLRACGRD